MTNAHTQSGWSWKHSPELMTRLRSAQNQMALAGGRVDVMSFAGLCDSEAELLRHVERCEADAAKVSHA